MSGALRRYKRYPAYKDSGEEWLGEIPEGWQVSPLKRLGDLQAGAGFPEAEQGLINEELPFFKVGDLGAEGNDREMRQPRHTISRITARRLRAFVFPPETVVFAKVGAALLLNRRRLLTQPSCIDNNMMGFIPRSCDWNWALYWLSGLDMGELANPGAVPSVNEAQMRETRTLVPSTVEQRAIARFLDHETARIDALMAKKERLFELLEEKRRALITRAVTKGLDPNVPMKDSGVEWLGEIPKHWDVQPSNALFRERNDRGQRDLPILEVSVRSGVRLREFSDSRIEQKSDDLAVYKVSRKGDIAFNKMRMWQGAVGETPADGLVSPDYIVASPRTPGDGAFYASVFRTSQCMAEVYGRSHGIVDDRNRLYWDDFKAMKLPVPPRDERDRIMDFIRSQSSIFRELASNVSEGIARAKELRTALISAAVTGKIDVREEVA